MGNQLRGDRARGDAVTPRRASIFRLLALVALSMTALAGCGGGSDLQTASIAAGPLTAGKARVTIRRPTTIVYAAAPAAITLNGQQVADIAVGSSAVIDVPTGAVVLAASAWSYPGSFSIKLNAKPGATYALIVEPRGDSFCPAPCSARLAERSMPA